MASSPQIDSVSAISATTTRGLDGNGASGAAAFYVDATISSAASGAWTISLYWTPDGTAAGGKLIAETASLVAANNGLNVATLQAPFTSANRAIPHPNLVVYTEDVGGDTLTATVHAFYGS